MFATVAHLGPLRLCDLQPGDLWQLKNNSQLCYIIMEPIRLVQLQGAQKRHGESGHSNTMSQFVGSVSWDEDGRGWGGGVATSVPGTDLGFFVGPLAYNPRGKRGYPHFTDEESKAPIRREQEHSSHGGHKAGTFSV